MDKVYVSKESPLFHEVLKLGDVNRSTLGFLPKQAFLEYAGKRQIYAITENNDLVAYVLYRYRGPALIIVQLCVAPEYRGKEYARKIIDSLLENQSENISHIQLSCRRDYNLEQFWSNIGFHPINERKGRATKQSTQLTIWLRENPNCQNLFSLQSYKTSEKIVAVLDTNIVIDLFQRDNEESINLQSDYINNYARLCISPDVTREINTHRDDSLRQQELQFATSYFEMLLPDNVLYLDVRDSIALIKPTDESSNTWFDISHIAYAISAGADVYLTRDSEWLHTEISLRIQEKYGISIMSPGEFIKYIDELSSPYQYAPQKLFGLDLHEREMSSSDLDLIADTFSQYYGKKNSFKDELRTEMANPKAYSIVIVERKSTPTAIICTEHHEKEEKVKMIYVNERIVGTSLVQTFVKWIAMMIVERCKDSRKEKVTILQDHLPEWIKEILTCYCGFLQSGSELIRVLIHGIQNKQEVEQILNNHNVDLKERYNSNGRMIWNLRIQERIESMFWPIKVSPSDIPCFIIPITAEYALELFDRRLSEENPCLFVNEKIVPALNTEKVYFKSNVHSIKEQPARILWYVSKSELQGTGAIRACSMLNSVEIGTQEFLFRKYHRLGVVEWDKLRQFGKTNGEIAAYMFSNTELFVHPIYLERVRVVMKKPHETFQSFRRISDDMFCKFYSLGVHGVEND